MSEPQPLLFEAPSEYGRLRLRLSSATPSGCAAEAALQLDRAEPLLAALDAWFAAAGLPVPAWAWQDGEAPSHEGGAEATWRDGAALLCLPWALLSRLPEPGDPLDAMLQWQPARAHCVLAALQLTREDLAALEPGGLVLPGVEADVWTAELQPAEAGAALRQPILLRPSLPPTVAGPATARLVPGDWELRCELRDALCPGALAGWAAYAERLQGLRIDGPWQLVRATDAVPDGPPAGTVLASGRGLR
jgi:hypothetical protein